MGMLRETFLGDYKKASDPDKRPSSVPWNWRNGENTRGDASAFVARPFAQAREQKIDARVSRTEAVGGGSAMNEVAVPLLPNLRCDGRMEFKGRSLLLFTELDKSAVSYGSTFTVDANAVLADAITAARAEMFCKFSAGRTGHNNKD
jgi:hypothetical protein